MRLARTIAQEFGGDPGCPARQCAVSADRRGKATEESLQSAFGLRLGVLPCTAAIAASWPKSARGRGASRGPEDGAIGGAPPERRLYRRRRERRGSPLRRPPSLGGASGTSVPPKWPDRRW